MELLNEITKWVLYALAFCVAYKFVYLFVGVFWKAKRYKDTGERKKFGILIIVLALNIHLLPIRYNATIWMSLLLAIILMILLIVQKPIMRTPILMVVGVDSM